MSRINQLIADMEAALVNDMVSNRTLKVWDELKPKIVNPDKLADWMRMKGFTKDSLINDIMDEWTNDLMEGLEEIYGLESSVSFILKGGEEDEYGS